MHRNESGDRWTTRTATQTLSPEPSGKLVEDGTLSIYLTRNPCALTLEICGEVDLANAGTLDAELVRAQGSDADRIVVDLGGLDFIDACGLRALLLATRRSAENPDRLAVIRGEGQVARILAITRIDEVLNLLD